MAGSRFKPLPHPSDLGIVAFGRNPKELFENAAFGMFSLMIDLDKAAANERFEIKVTGEDRESLLINWLNELIYVLDGKKVLLSDFKIKNISETALTAVVAGEKLDTKKHQGLRPIKAATYNQLRIEADKATIVFDV